MQQEFVLGTAQLGLPYGVSNRTGQPNVKDAFRILDRAVQLGVRQFDTAAAYGNSEILIGDFFAQTSRADICIHTKLSPLTEYSDSTNDQDLVDAVEKSVENSLKNLKTTKLDTLLLHRSEHMHLRNGIIWQKLLDLKSQGVIQRLGASLTLPEQARLLKPQVELVQIPFNILDRRWWQVALIFRERGIECLVRSVFLQGALTLENPSEWPKLKTAYSAEKLISQLQRWGEACRKTTKELAVAYVKAFPWVNGVVIGCETADQLADNVRLFNDPPLAPEMVSVIKSTPVEFPDTLVNPFEWGRAQ